MIELGMLGCWRAYQVEEGDWVTQKNSLVLSAPRVEEILSRSSQDENTAVWGDCGREVTRGISNSKQSGERSGSMGERDLATSNT